MALDAATGATIWELKVEGQYVFAVQDLVADEASNLYFGWTSRPTRYSDSCVGHLASVDRAGVCAGSAMDAPGFWERHYPAVRRELMRKYPRHAWPENGATASPPGR